MKCTIIGAGSWWTALGQVLSENGHETRLFSLFQADADSINQKHENFEYLPWVQLHEKLTCSTNLAQTLAGAEIIVLAVPSKGLTSCLRELKPYYAWQPVVLASKGWNASDFSPLSSLITEKLGAVPIIVLSGASHAEEVVKHQPTKVVLASSGKERREKVKNLFHNKRFKCEESEDIVGVQLMGAFKNIIALACGISDGLKYGTNTKALILTEGIQEISKIGSSLKIKPETRKSSAGIGDLYVTCSSVLSRNRNAGRLLAEGHSKAEITGGLINMVAESLYLTEAIAKFLATTNESFPLLDMIIKIVEYNIPAQKAFDLFLESS